MCPGTPTSNAGSSGPAVAELGESPSLELVGDSCVIIAVESDIVTGKSLSSSGGHVCVLASPEIAVGGGSGSVSSLGVGIVYKEAFIWTEHERMQDAIGKSRHGNYRVQ